MASPSQVSLLLRFSAIPIVLAQTPTHTSPSDKPSLGPQFQFHLQEAKLKEVTPQGHSLPKWHLSIIKKVFLLPNGCRPPKVSSHRLVNSQTRFSSCLLIGRVSWHNIQPVYLCTVVLFDRLQETYPLKESAHRAFILISQTRM